MKRETREQLKVVYEAPPPLRKKEFVRRWNQPQMNLREVICSQVSYIRKWVWAVSVIIFVTAVFGAVTAAQDFIWMVSALTPFLAVTMIAESGRSDHYEMAELEMATRFSLRSVLFARLLILGAENMLIICILFLAGIWRGGMQPFQTGMCILIPYLVTSFIGLCTVHRYRGSEAMYFCMGAAAAVSVFVFCSKDMLTRIYREYDSIWWWCTMLLLVVCVGRQYINMLIKTEELA